MGIVTRQLIVHIVISMCSIIAAIVHGDKIKKINIGILPVMLKKMIEQVWQFK